MKLLIVEARYYDNISDLLLTGATTAAKAASANYDIITVPGALEIPAAIKFNVARYDAFVALGCVIRGETYHFEIVANESARGLQTLALHDGLAIGNGILTTENEEQAIKRAGEYDKGGDAVRAALKLLEIKKAAG